MKTPWQMAEVGSEYAHQTALFAWAAVAVQAGIAAANDPDCYTIKGHMEVYRQTSIDRMVELQWLHAIKNAGHGDAIRGARAAAEGVRAGVPDIFLPVPRYGWNGIWTCGLYIELKRPSSKGKAAGNPSDVQIKWADYLQRAGYQVAICYGWEAARDAILSYLGR